MSLQQQQRLGGLIARARRERGLSLRGVAKRTGEAGGTPVTHDTVRRAELGESIKVSSLTSILLALEIDPARALSDTAAA
jgi:transcriptional regulator with XRE-family HTH domain